MTQALIIIDVQREYFPEGKRELYEPEKALAQTQKVLQMFREKNLAAAALSDAALCIAAR